MNSKVRYSLFRCILLPKAHFSKCSRPSRSCVQLSTKSNDNDSSDKAEDLLSKLTKNCDKAEKTEHIKSPSRIKQVNEDLTDELLTKLDKVSVPNVVKKPTVGDDSQDLYSKLTSSSQSSKESLEKATFKEKVKNKGFQKKYVKKKSKFILPILNQLVPETSTGQDQNTNVEEKKSVQESKTSTIKDPEPCGLKQTFTDNSGDQKTRTAQDKKLIMEPWKSDGPWEFEFQKHVNTTTKLYTQNRPEGYRIRPEKPKLMSMIDDAPSVDRVDVNDLFDTTREFANPTDVTTLLSKLNKTRDKSGAKVDNLSELKIIDVVKANDKKEASEPKNKKSEKVSNLLSKLQSGNSNFENLLNSTISTMNVTSEKEHDFVAPVDTHQVHPELLLDHEQDYSNLKIIEELTPRFKMELINGTTERKIRLNKLEKWMKELTYKGYVLPETLNRSQWDQILKYDGNRVTFYYLEAVWDERDKDEELLKHLAKMDQVTYSPMIYEQSDLEKVVGEDDDLMVSLNFRRFSQRFFCN